MKFTANITLKWEKIDIILENHLHTRRKKIFLSEQQNFFLADLHYIHIFFLNSGWTSMKVNIFANLTNEKFISKCFLFYFLWLSSWTSFFSSIEKKFKSEKMSISKLCNKQFNLFKFVFVSQNEFGCNRVSISLLFSFVFSFLLSNLFFLFHLDSISSSFIHWNQISTVFKDSQCQWYR